MPDREKSSRGYAWLNVRSVDEAKRIIEGIATTPKQARDGDIIETSGIQFKLPIPFLYRHSEPMGNVISAKVTEEGIAVRVQVAAAGVTAKIDEYWNLVRSGTVRGLSIGWRTILEAYDKEINGYRILKSEWLELSAVPVPADAHAQITAVRSADEAILAAIGRNRNRQHQNPPGASGSQRNEQAMKSLKERIAALVQKRDGLQTEMETIDSAMTAEGRDIMTADESAQYDPLATEARGLDAQITRLRAMQRDADTAVPAEAVVDGVRRVSPASARIEVKPVELEKGIRFARAVIALVRAGGSHYAASTLAREEYKDTPEVAMFLRSVVAAGDTQNATWAAPLIPGAGNVGGEFIEMLRPATLIGRIPNLRRVPFNTKVPVGTGDSTYRWVGESSNKPVGQQAYSSATLLWTKAAGIVVISDELARFSSPAAESLIRDQMVKGCVKFIDSQFIDENIAEVSGVSPASILNSIAAVASASATTAAGFRVDLNKLYAAFIAANADPASAVILMSSTTAMALGSMMNALGQQEFPSLTLTGGNINGIPVIASEHVGNRLVLLAASDILYADDGSVRVDVSREASIEMDTLPTSGEGSPATNVVLHSMFQRNEIAIRVERMINWKRARVAGVQWISGVAYLPS